MLIQLYIIGLLMSFLEKMYRFAIVGPQHNGQTKHISHSKKPT